MDVNNMGQVTIGTYFKQWWQSLPPAPKKRWWTVLGIFTAIWLAGAIHAPSAVAGLARVEGPFRLLMSLGMGGFSFLWRILKSTGAIQETMDKPNLLWLPLALAVPGAIGLFLYILSQPPNPSSASRRCWRKRPGPRDGWKRKMSRRSWRLSAVCRWSRSAKVRKRHSSAWIMSNPRDMSLWWHLRERAKGCT
ncbi:MAG: hypothetical protein M5U34_45290 [Chloroflexi bacterium]|nr:hypothetical protein [Chloroflexota bacterium]